MRENYYIITEAGQSFYLLKQKETLFWRAFKLHVLARYSRVISFLLGFAYDFIKIFNQYAT